MTRVLAAAAWLAWAGIAAAAPRPQIHWVMGTYFRIAADGPGAAAALEECFAEARRLDGVFSRFDAASELSRLNRDGRGEASPAMEALLHRSLGLAGRTGGAFDVSAGALTALWRDRRAPAPTAVAAARASVGGLRLDGTRVTLAPGTRLDFDGIAKGWAVDACVSRLRAHGVERALVSLGESSLYALGAPAGEATWPLLVRGVDPELAVGVLRLRDRAVSISASRGADGRHPHIVDPRTGQLVGGGAVALVVADSATDAEAYSKALLVWGEGGVRRVERLGDVEAARVTAAGVERGVAMARGRTLRPFATPRPLGLAEEGLP